MAPENVTVRAFHRDGGWTLEVTSASIIGRRCVYGVGHQITDRLYPELKEALEAGTTLALQMFEEDKAATPKPKAKR